MDLQAAIRLRLIQLMELHKLNANKLALICGISRSTINKFIRQTTKSLTIETITLICQTLNMTLSEFFDDPIFVDIIVDD